MRVLTGLLLAAMVVLATWEHSTLAENNPLVPDQVERPIDEPMVEPRSLRSIIDDLGWSSDDLRIHVDKSDREMGIWVRDSLIKTYTIVLGLSPVGDKQMEGDRKTPEGTFTFRDKYPHKDWHKFVWVDYPNEESWQKFKQRKKDGIIPNDARIGGEIGIHGVPKGMDDWVEKGNDWTFGCIGMKNADLDELYPFISKNSTVIRISP